MSRNPLVAFLEGKQGAAGSAAAMAPAKPSKKKAVSRSGQPVDNFIEAGTPFSRAVEKHRHRISAEGRQRIRDAVKKRWAEAHASGRTTLKK